MEHSYRRILIRAVTFFAGLYFFVEFILPAEITAIPALGLPAFRFGRYHDAISWGCITVGTMALGLGIINLIIVHGSRIVFKRSGWINSFALLVGMALMLGVSLMDWIGQERIVAELRDLRVFSDFAGVIPRDAESGRSDVPSPKYRTAKLVESVTSMSAELRDDLEKAYTQIDLNSRDSRVAANYYSESLERLETVGQLVQILEQDFDGSDFSTHQRLSEQLNQTAVIAGQLLRLSHKQSLNSRLWVFLFDGLFVALGSAMFSLLGIYVASAAYRAFRIQSLESTLMMGAAVLVMLGQISFGLWLSQDLPAIRQWLLEYPNSAAFRAIKIGAAVAGLVMAFRMWLSLESEYRAGSSEGNQ